MSSGKSRKKNNICRLCLLDKTLLKKSHIIPKFMYKGIISEDNKIIQTNLNDTTKKKTIRTGAYEPHILCQECDNNVIGKLESYASELLFGNWARQLNGIKLSNEISQDGIKSLRVQGVDYNKFKLFLLSILWRASVSDQALFKKVILGSALEERLRDKIVNQEADEDDEYEVSVIIFNPPKTSITRIITQPIFVKDEYILFFVNSVGYYINLSNDDKLPLFEKCKLARDGTMIILTLEGEVAATFIDKIIGKPLRLR